MKLLCGDKFQGDETMSEGVKCEQCQDTGWANVKRADGREEKVLCYCHPLVVSGKIKALSGSYYLTKYIQLEQKKHTTRKRGKGKDVQK